MELPCFGALRVTELCGFGQLVLTTAAGALLGVPVLLAAVTLAQREHGVRVLRTTC